MTNKPEEIGKEAIWVGDDEILVAGARVLILASDHDDPSVPARRACWVRYWPDRRDYPMYRSCDLSDLEIDAALSPTKQEEEGR